MSSRTSTPEIMATNSLFWQAVREFLASLRTSKKSANTINAYTADLIGVADLLASSVPVVASDLATSHLTIRCMRFAFAEFADRHSAASVSRAWSSWNRFCDFLVADGALAGNPMAAIERPRPGKTAPRAFAEESVTRLVELLETGRIPARKPWPSRDYAALVTLIVTGVRAGEFLGLHIGDVEGSAGQRFIRVTGKGDKTRNVPIEPALEQVLGCYLRSRWERFPHESNPFIPAGQANEWNTAPATTPLWANDTGSAMSVGQLEHLTRRAYRAAGIESERQTGALVHALRHTFATRLTENGASIVEVQELLGHASLQTTQRYLGTRPEYLRNAVAANPVYRAINQRPVTG